MKKILTSMLLLTALFFIPSYSYPSNLGMVRLSLMEGDIQIYTEDTLEWVGAAINMPLREGDRMWVPERGRAEIQLNDGTSIRLSESSSLDILRTEDHSFQFYLDTGHAYVNFRGVGGHLLQLDTPVSSIRTYERGIFRVDVPDDRSTDISVKRGFVYAETNKGSTTIDEGYTLSIRGDDYADLHPLELSDGWERWNEERDRALYEKRYSSRYLPEELSPYSYDFDRYGKWVYAREYGYVWTPSVIVSVRWSPYRQGRWVWIRGDYVWVSYEPWGWVPYHYGRWIFNVSIGWCWVPPARGAVYWGPGFVSWVYTPDYVAWVPLAPREIYYGYGHYGPHSVNITNVNITNIRVRNVYKNVYVNNAVTVVHRDTFVRGKDVPVRVKDNPFLKERIHIGRPAINPIKETRRPDLREIKGGNQPPMRIREIKVEERKKERPLVQKRTYSVMRPGAPTREMPFKSVKGRAPGEREMEQPSRERKEYKAPAERKIERPERQEQPLKKKKVLPEQKSTRPGPAMKEAPSKIERSKAPLERGVPSKQERSKAPAEKTIEKPATPLEHKEYRVPSGRKLEKPQTERQMPLAPEKSKAPVEQNIERPPLEKKGYGIPSKKESEKPQKQIVPGERKKEVPEQKDQEQREIERPGGQGTPFEKRGESPMHYKPRQERVERF
jgi:hypothetical protein